MAEWPTLDEVMHMLDIGDDEATQTMLTSALDSAIEAVKQDVGQWDEAHDEPDARLHEAALRAVQVLRTNAPDDGWRSLREDRIYLSFIQGHKRTFGVA